MSWLGIDYGTKKIGVAKTDDEHRISVPLKTITFENKNQLSSDLQGIIKEEDIDKIIVGLPESMAGKQDVDNQQIKDVLEFTKWLEEETSLEVKTQDERLTTQVANNMPKELIKQYGDDAIAAMLILESYIDKK